MGVGVAQRWKSQVSGVPVFSWLHLSSQDVEYRRISKHSVWSVVSRVDGPDDVGLPDVVEAVGNHQSQPTS